MKHAVYAEEQLLQAPLLFCPPSAHRFVMVLADVRQDAAIGRPEVRGYPPPCSNTFFGPCSRANSVHVLESSQPSGGLGFRGVSAGFGGWLGLVPFFGHAPWEDDGVAPSSSLLAIIPVVTDEVSFGMCGPFVLAFAPVLFSPFSPEPG